MSPENQQKTGTLKRGWLITRASWKVMWSDKELLAFAFLSIFTSALVLCLFAFIGYMILLMTGSDFQAARDEYHNSEALPYWIFPLIVVVFIVVFSVVNYFTACITAGALDRFRGGSPTFRSSMHAADQIKSKIFAFSFYQGLSLGVIELLRKIRIIGGSLAFLGEMAFTVGTFFVLPVMIDSKGAVGPLEATKTSASIIRKVWGESIVISFGALILAIIAGVVYTILWCVALFGIAHLLPSSDHEVNAFLFASAIMGTLAVGYGVLMAFYSALSSIFTAALYLYATTGEAPAEFDTALLDQSISPKVPLMSQSS